VAHVTSPFAARPFDELVAAAERCTNCPLYRNATQTVFGEGPVPSELMVVGEQPGDQEDIQGRPFVGPAGGVLDRALREAGLDREAVYVTNIVKHFKWQPRGKRRIHQKPNREEVAACRPWFDAEVAHVEPRLVVCLGATAAQALLGSGFRVTRQRGQLIEWDGRRLIATVHPSSILRAPDDQRQQAFEAFRADVVVAAKALAEQ
jgi:uracil-DNA glycosylase family protein